MLLIPYVEAIQRAVSENKTNALYINHALTSFTVFAGVFMSAGASVVADLVVAGSTILAWPTGTFIDFCKTCNQNILHWFRLITTFTMMTFIQHLHILVR